MDLDSSPTTTLATDIKLERTEPMHNNRPTMELHNSTHAVIGVIMPEIIHSTLVGGNRSIDIRVNFLAGMMTTTTGIALPRNPIERNLAEYWNRSSFSFWSETRSSAELAVSALAA